MLKVFDLVIADDGGFDINDCAAEITGQIISIPRRRSSAFSRALAFFSLLGGTGFSSHMVVFSFDLDVAAVLFRAN